MKSGVANRLRLASPGHFNDQPQQGLQKPTQPPARSLLPPPNNEKQKARGQWRTVRGDTAADSKGSDGWLEKQILANLQTKSSWPPIFCDFFFCKKNVCFESKVVKCQYFGSLMHPEAHEFALLLFHPGMFFSKSPCQSSKQSQ